MPQQNLMVDGSLGLDLTFVALAIVLGGLFVLGVHVAWRRSQLPVRRATIWAAVATVLWMDGVLAAAAAGLLRFEPPTIVPILLLTLVGSVTIGLSPIGQRLAAGLPLAALVGVQSFRLPLELAMHRAYTEGVMPVQMSYSGYNFDIVTGILAIIVALLVATGRAGTKLVHAWNWLGVLLLANILVIAILSTPLFRVFDTEPPNVWITQPPFIWLPTVMVATAIIGHVVIFRRLNMETARR